jgi:hypothetical protein
VPSELDNATASGEGGADARFGGEGRRRGRRKREWDPAHRANVVFGGETGLGRPILSEEGTT